MKDICGFFKTDIYWRCPSVGCGLDCRASFAGTKDAEIPFNKSQPWTFSRENAILVWCFRIDFPPGKYELNICNRLEETVGSLYVKGPDQYLEILGTENKKPKKKTHTHTLTLFLGALE